MTSTGPSGTHKGRAAVRQMIGFRLGPENFAIDISKIHEIIKPLPITVVPNVPTGFCGVIQLRDQVIVVADLHAQFGFVRPEETKETRIVVLEGSARRIGVMVDSVSEVVRFSPTMIDPSPGFHGGISADFIEGIGKLNGELLTLLDVDAIFPDNNVSQEQEMLEETVCDTPEPPTSVANTITPQMNAELMDELGKQATDGSELYRDLGELARYINVAHQQFAKGLAEETNIKTKARDLPTAYEMLSSVTEETETATMKVMSHTEETGSATAEMRGILEQIEEAIPASHESFAKVGDLTERLRQECTTIEGLQDETMMTMAFQDLTGQKIKQVIVLMAEVEERILKLVVEFGMNQAQESEEAIEAKIQTLTAEEVAGVNQGGVDDILAEFGF